MRYIWNKLSRQQVGAFSEYFVKMEFTMYGFQVYTTEVDDRGIDFIARYNNGSFLRIQVKSIRETGYVFMKKDKFILSKELYLALAILNEGKEPDLYLIPSAAWRKPNDLFKNRNYEGKESHPEWGLNISDKNMPLLKDYSFSQIAERIICEQE